MASLGRKIRKVLIANRGEIACRVMRTLSELGIKSVAVYSEADAHAKHTQIADEALPIGKSEASASYLNQKAIILAAKKARVDAIHPGYGFLSENSDFAAQVKKAGLIFIGPNAETIKLCGDKLRAKELAVKLSVPTVPGITLGKGKSDLKAFLKKSGFPILIKAAAGGGGRGMRKVFSQAGLQDAMQSASREALAAFGNADLFVEKLVTNARHIEVQLLGDLKGSVTHLFDRDCTMQRNHQKIIEEAPASGISSKVREGILESAVQIASAAKYASTGTAEFLLDEEEKFYFLEINSRLQVEHTVTEEITGLDLVRLQIEVAEGRRLSEILPARIIPRGNAIECRICAEIPEDNFRPDSGRISTLEIGRNGKVRFDSGFRSGDVVSHYYDSLVAKLVVSGPDRDSAILRAREACSEMTFTGVRNNQALLVELLNSKQFATLKHHTEFIARFLCTKRALIPSYYAAIASLIFETLGSDSDSDIWGEPSAFRLGGSSDIKEKFLINGKRELEVVLRPLGYDSFTASVESESFEVKVLSKAKDTLRFNADGELVTFTKHSSGWLAGSLGSFHLQKFKPVLRRSGASAENLAPDIKSSLPGKVVSLKVKKGVHVKVGDVLLVIESMKMEHPILAPAAAKVLKIPAIEGKVVEAGEALITLEYEKK